MKRKLEDMRKLKNFSIAVLILILSIFNTGSNIYASEYVNEFVYNQQSNNINVQFQLISSIYEPKYLPDIWNNDYELLRQTNCYSYAVFGSVYQKVMREIPINPGTIVSEDIARYPYFDKELIIEKVKKDLKVINEKNLIEECNFNTIPVRNQRKVALFITEDRITDYHWYLHNENGYWSHKRGMTEVTNIDADGKLIKNPELANRNYGYLNYTEFCGYYLITISSEQELKEDESWTECAIKPQ